MIHTSRADEPFENRKKLLQLIGSLIKDTIALLPHVKEESFCYGSCWCVLVTCSYIQDQTQQKRLLGKLHSHRSSMAMYQKGAQLLQWVRNDEYAFGLSGLESIAQVRSIGVCIC
jgi:hypothetical protein